MISLALVLCICLSVVMTPKAHAISELIIVGAIALTLGAVAAVVILAAEPLGLKEPIIAAAQHGFQSPREFTANLLDRFGASQGIQRFVMLDRFQKGLMITTAGKVILDKAISDFLTKFYEWAWNDTLSEFATVVSLETVNPSTIPNFPIPINANISYGNGYAEVPIQSPSYIYSSSAPFVLVNSGGNTKMCFFSDTYGGTVSVYDIYGGTTSNIGISYSVTRSINGVSYKYYYSSRYVYSTATTADLWSQSSFDATSAFNAAYTYYHAQDYMTGSGEEGTYDEDGLVLPAPDSSNVLDVPGALSLPAPISGTTTATQYLEAAADAITAGSGSLEYEDAYGSTQTGTLEGTGEIGLTQVGAQSAELEGAIDIADSVGSETLDNYTIDLRDFFPFCIPFDLWDMLNLLESAPAPVSVEWQFDFGQLGEYQMEINLEEWNSVAQTLRTMELLAFCFGLAMLTKRILMGS